MWYKRPLFYILTSAVLLVGGVGAVVALKDDPKPVVATSNSQKQNTEVVARQDVPTVETPAIVSSPEPGVPTPTTTPAPQVANPYTENSSEWYVFKRRTDVNRPLPGGLGSGYTWDDRAFALGLTVDHSVEVGAVACINSSRSGGSVAIVDTINADGSITVSYMTDLTKTLTPEQAGLIYYIH